MTNWTFWTAGLAIVNFVTACSVTIHAVLWKRDSRAVIGWVGLAWLAPFLGAVAYVCLGVNRIERKARSIKQNERWKSTKVLKLSTHDKHSAEDLAREHHNLVGLAKAGRKLSAVPLVPGNRVEPLVNGDQAYPAMIETIGSAKTSVSLMSYIFDNDQAGEAFLEALVKANERGVHVRVLIDDVGSRYTRPTMLGRLKDAGLTATSFLPTRVPRLPRYANLRNHRKILVADGRVGFTGGTNIREGHCLELKTQHPVQCLHFRLEGPVVAHLQRVFAEDWAFATGEEIFGDDWFPQLRHAGEVWARGIEDGPDEHFEAHANIIAAALASAKERARIVTPYFVPNSSLIQALNVTALRGVRVEIYLPSVNNIALVQWASTAQLWQILEKGCHVYYTAPPFDHTKLMIVDDAWTLIGSTNWDARSLRLNFEFNVECYDEQLAKSVNAVVDGKSETAREVTLDEVNGRSLPTRLRDGLARLLTPYL